MPKLIIRRLDTLDPEVVRSKIIESWGAEIVVAHGVIFLPAELPGLAAFFDRKLVGIITYAIDDAGCEIVTLNSWQECMGVASKLIKKVTQIATQAGCNRLHLVTTNDNVHALRFYQKRGFTISAVHLNAIAGSRDLKPHIPIFGMDGIPIRDEIELELIL